MVPKVTNKQLKANYSYIINCGYAEFSNFKSQLKKIGYNCGVYGWNYSAYQLTEQVVLIDSYRNAPSQGLTAKQAEKARKLIQKYNAEVVKLNNIGHGYQTSQQDAIHYLIIDLYKLIG